MATGREDPPTPHASLTERLLYWVGFRGSGEAARFLRAFVGGRDPRFGGVWRVGWPLLVAAAVLVEVLDDVAPQLFHLGVGRFVSSPDFRSQLVEPRFRCLAIRLYLGPDSRDVHGVATDRTLEQKISDAGPFDQRIDPHVLTDVRSTRSLPRANRPVAVHIEQRYRRVGEGRELPARRDKIHERAVPRIMRRT